MVVYCGADSGGIIIVLYYFLKYFFDLLTFSKKLLTIVLTVFCVNWKKHYEPHRITIQAEKIKPLTEVSFKDIQEAGISHIRRYAGKHQEDWLEEENIEAYRHP